MRAGCLDVQRSDDGLIERYRVKSIVYKRRDVRGLAHGGCSHRVDLLVDLGNDLD